jgi:hypothetical protein
VEGDTAFDEEDCALIDRLARFLVRRRMAVPAAMLLESGRPMNFLGSQFLVFLGPFATMVFPSRDYERLAGILERRGSVDMILERIAAAENEQDLTAKVEKTAG